MNQLYQKQLTDISIQVSRVHISAPGQPSTPKKPAEGGGVLFPSDYFDRCNTPPPPGGKLEL